MSSKHFGIVGGGIMGLTLALRLAQKGHKVELYEGADEIGGLASAWKMGEVEWDKFYHVILLSDFKTREILGELGLEDKINWVKTKTGFYIGGKLYSMSDSIEFLKFPTLRLIDKFRLGMTIIIASRIKAWKRLEKIPVEKWLKYWSGKKTFDSIWLPLLKAKLGDSYKKTSAVFIWATIQRLYSARRNGLKKEMFGYVPGGYKRILEALKAKLILEGVEIHTSHKTENIKANGSGKVKVSFSNGSKQELDYVIVTLPSGLAANICNGISSLEIEKHRTIEYLGVVCVTLLLDKPISPYYITNITDTWVPFTGVIEMSALVNKEHLGGYSMVYLPKYVQPEDPLFRQTDEEIATHFIDMLLKMYPELKIENIKFKGVGRAQNVITVATLGYSDRLPEIKTSIPGVYIINSAHIKDGTVNVNETIKVAEEKLRELLEEIR